MRDRSDWSRREMLAAVGSALLGGALLPGGARAAAPVKSASAESLVEELYASLSAAQREKICFAWDHVDPKRGLLRTRVAANWQITDPAVDSDFFRADQRALIRAIFEGITSPEWHARFDRQLADDAGGFGRHQAIAIFGVPGRGPSEFVLSGRHMTLRCDGNATDHVAFGGPIFYGHAAGTWWSGGFVEKADHPGNVFWPQALAANRLYRMLDGRQREAALVARLPEEHAVLLRGDAAARPGIAIPSLAPDQREEAQRVLQILIEPFRASDRDEVVAALRAQGGLDSCSLAFYSGRDVGGDGVWDHFRLEGPAFAWYFRGAPHVHVWVHVADRPGIALNAEA
jgi:hypothetical protein